MTAQGNEDLAYTILWSPLPPITWLVPFIGHLGIATSSGVACDFQGSYYVSDRGRMAFGEPTRALKINIDQIPGGAQAWDEMVREANNLYSTRVHNIVADNCHSHVACALDKMQAPMPFPFSICGQSWDMVKLCFLVFFKARFLSFSGFVKQFAPFTILMCLIFVPSRIF